MWRVVCKACLLPFWLKEAECSCQASSASAHVPLKMITVECPLCRMISDYSALDLQQPAPEPPRRTPPPHL